MKFEEMGLETGETLLLLPGTACTWQINFAMVIDDLKERYHLICVNYDGFDGDNSQILTTLFWVAPIWTRAEKRWQNLLLESSVILRKALQRARRKRKN